LSTRARTCRSRCAPRGDPVAGGLVALDETRRANAESPSRPHTATEVEAALHLTVDAHARATRVLGEQHPHSLTAAANLSAVRQADRASEN
jgi:hypothetical protein